MKNIIVKIPIKTQYQPNIFNENLEINFIKYLIQKYPTMADTIVPKIIAVQLYSTASATSIFING